MVVSSLFYIKDLVSGLRITSFLEFVNEGVALQAFKKFVDERPEDSRACFKLMEVADVEDDCVLFPTGRVICSGENVDSVLQEYIRNACEQEA